MLQYQILDGEIRKQVQHSTYNPWHYVLSISPSYSEQTLNYTIKQTRYLFEYLINLGKGISTKFICIKLT